MDKDFVNLQSSGADHEQRQKSSTFLYYTWITRWKSFTFTGKAVVSGHAGLHSSMVAAMNALSGPLHKEQIKPLWSLSKVSK